MGKVVEAVKKAVTKKPVKKVVEKLESKPCIECKGTGLLDRENLCVVCDGSGSI